VFDLSFGEILLIITVAFIIFGPEKFPVMVKEAVGWIKKIKTMAYEAQRSFDDLGQSVKEDLGLTKLWTPTLSTSTPDQKELSHLKPIEVDRHSGSYVQQSVPWRSTLVVDRNEAAYRVNPLATPPWRSERVTPSSALP